MPSTDTREPGSSSRYLRFRTLLIAAAIWHVLLTVTVFGLGKYQLFASQIYPSGIARFASDGIIYQEQCRELASILKQQGIAAWATWPTQLHVRLYSLPYALVSRWFSFNILTIEPLNLIYYLGILSLVFVIAQAVFDRNRALIAVVIVGLWPSFALHTTQLLRDPLLVLSFLLLIASIVETIRHKPTWRTALLWGAGGIGAIISIRIVRLPMWYIVCATVGLGIVLVVIRTIREKRLTTALAVFSVLLLAAIIFTPRLQPWFRNQQELRAKAVLPPERVQQWTVEEQIAGRREAFKLRLDEKGNVAPAEDGSRIDADVKFQSFGDIVRQIPRAIVVGFFAPFPNMWFQSGHQVGFGGRWISGLEMILMYAIEALALVGLWRARRNLSAWLLMCIVGMGIVALGLVVSNVGALYRLRYPFWALLVVLGSSGAAYLLRKSSLLSNSRSV
jgi:hypothetical protein